MIAGESHGMALHQALWQRLEQHDFGTGDCALSFVQRLAREHGWSAAQADAAILEYKRFCFLAVVAGHPVTPSDAVDEVWHQHLTYSRDYWTRYCPQVLGRDLHHEPTRGGRDQGRLHQRQYADTLASYQHWFGPPPLEWWPDAQTQAQQPAHFRRIDTSRHLLLPRPRWPRLSWRRWLAAAGLAAVAPTLAALPLNPLDFSGPEFLFSYVVALVLCLIGAAWLRAGLRNIGPAKPGDALDTWSVAYLAGGTTRVVDAAVASLLADDKAQWNEREKRLSVARPRDVEGFPLAEIARYSAAGAKIDELPARIEPELRRLREPLLRRGLLLNDEQRARIGRLTALPFLLLGGLGVAKFGVGIARDRPVFLLGLLIALTAFFAWRRWVNTPESSSAGDELLRGYNLKHAHVRRAPRDGDVGLAVALAGTTVLAGTAYAAFHDYRQPASNSSSSSSDSSSSGDSGGSCSSGCGGCGGGD